MNKEQFLARAPKPPTHDADGRYSLDYMRWLKHACQVCTVDGEDGSCIIGLSGCKWT